MGGGAGVSNPCCDICGVVDYFHNKMYCNIINRELNASVMIKLRMRKLEAALERISKHDKIILGEHMDEVRKIAREALE